jgi:arsenate reductase (glutaredoxin)
MAITIYGIKNCETMNKARAWLDEHGVDYAFHDYKTAGVDRERLERWSKKVGWEALLNRAGMTFRKLPDKDKAGINDGGKITGLLSPLLRQILRQTSYQSQTDRMILI